MKKTRIEWCDSTWNPLRGCSRVSEGCRNCYAERVAARFSGEGQPYEGVAIIKSHGPQWTGKIQLVEKHLDDPLRWKRSRRIFVNSMSDLFHENVPDAWIDRIFAVMALCPRHIFQVLTKRPERMLLYSERIRKSPELLGAHVDPANPKVITQILHRWPPPNVWMGVSVENQKTADERLPYLLRTRAAMRFVSAEPLLGVVDLTPWLPKPTCGCGHAETDHYGDRTYGCQGGDGSFGNPICGCRKLRGEREHNLGDPYDNHGLHWVIVGGESGPRARPVHPDWVRSLRDQCVSARVPFFFKQWGEYAPIAPTTGMPLREAYKLVGVNVDGQIVHHIGGDAACMWRAGKKRAGRVLDSCEWSELPELLK